LAKLGQQIMSAPSGSGHRGSGVDLTNRNGSFVAGKQHVDQLNWIDPKTGLPPNYNPDAAAQNYGEGSHGTRATAARIGNRVATSGAVLDFA
jgi:hypothetical protein